MIEPRPNEEKLVPLDTSGESIDVEVKDKEQETKSKEPEVTVEQVKDI